VGVYISLAEVRPLNFLRNISHHVGLHFPQHDTMATGKGLTYRFHAVKADEYTSENIYSNLGIHFPNAIFVDLNFSLNLYSFTTDTSTLFEIQIRCRKS